MNVDVEVALCMANPMLCINGILEVPEPASYYEEKMSIVDFISVS